MDDRLDFQLVSWTMLDGIGLDYIPNTYHALGNNGTHPLDGNINDPANTALPSAVLDALFFASDHLPVIADYRLPAQPFHDYLPRTPLPTTLVPEPARSASWILMVFSLALARERTSRT